MLGNAVYVSVAVDGANFRTGPGLSYDIKWDLDKNYPLQVLVVQGDWRKVKDYQGYVGWVHEKIFSQKKTVIVKGTIINLRQGPGLGYRVIGKAYQGQMFLVLRKYGEWYRVQDCVTDKIYWVHGSLIWGNK